MKEKIKLKISIIIIFATPIFILLFFFIFIPNYILNSWLRFFIFFFLVVLWGKIVEVLMKNWYKPDTINTLNKFFPHAHIDEKDEINL